jgi:cytochrome oxidase assembly protein ShyY1
VYRFALKPKWILSHLFIVALVVTMLFLCNWQWGKYQAIKVTNRTVVARVTAPPVDLATILKPGDPTSTANGLLDKAVFVTGTYEADQQVIVRGRALNDETGDWVLTPLRRADGSLVIVNRGFISDDGSQTAVPARYAPQKGVVTVYGLVQPTAERDGVGSKDPPTGHLTSLARADIVRYAKQLDAPVVPAWVQLLRTNPKSVQGNDVPELLGPPDLSEGPYFSYAVQWMVFSLIAIGGYPLILRRNAREKARERIDDGYVEPTADSPVTHPSEPAETETVAAPK